MSGVALAVGVSAVVGAGASYYSANKNAEAAKDSASDYNNKIQSYLESDKEVQQWTKDMYQYGDIDSWVTADGQAAKTTPYTSTMQQGMGYYVDKKGLVVTKERYEKSSRKGKKNLEKYGLTWVPATNAANKDNSQQAIEKNELEFMAGIQDEDQKYRADSLAAAAGLLPVQTEAARAQQQAIIDTTGGAVAATNATNLYTTDVMPGKAAAENATNLYTTNTMPMKQQAVSDALALAGRNTESEAARMAGAEVAQAFNAKQQTLGESIRRTGAVAGSGRMAGLQEDLDMNRVKATAGARTAARQNAQKNQYAQLAQAIQLI